MSDDAADRAAEAERVIARQIPAYFLLARPTVNTDRLPSSIGERDVFFSEDEALDALDVHYAWCAADHGGFSDVVTTSEWYLQTAMVGPRISPALGEVYLTTVDERGQTCAVAGGFLTEGELIHWSAFVRSVRPRIPLPCSGEAFELAYRGDTGVQFGQIWFAPMRSMRVYPKPIVVDEDAAG